MKLSKFDKLVEDGMKTFDVPEENKEILERAIRIYIIVNRLIWLFIAAFVFVSVIVLFSSCRIVKKVRHHEDSKIETHSEITTDVNLKTETTSPEEITDLTFTGLADPEKKTTTQTAIIAGEKYTVTKKGKDIHFRKVTPQKTVVTKTTGQILSQSNEVQKSRVNSKDVTVKKNGFPIWVYIIAILLILLVLLYFFNRVRG